MVWDGSDLKDHLVQLSCHRKGHFPLDQVVQSPIPPWSWTLPGMGHPWLLWKPVSVPHHSHSKVFFLNIWSKSTLYQSETIPLILSLHALIKSPLQISCSCPSFESWKWVCRKDRRLVWFHIKLHWKEYGYKYNRYKALYLAGKEKGFFF